MSNHMPGKCRMKLLICSQIMIYMLTKFSSLAAPEVVKMTTFDASNGKNVKMTFPAFGVHVGIKVCSQFPNARGSQTTACDHNLTENCDKLLSAHLRQHAQSHSHLRQHDQSRAPAQCGHQWTQQCLQQQHWNMYMMVSSAMPTVVCLEPNSEYIQSCNGMLSMKLSPQK